MSPRAAPFAGTAEPGLWRAVAAHRRHWHEWGGDSVVFDDASGETHRFSPLAAAAMAWIEEQPHSTASLVNCIARHLEVEPTEELLHALGAVLDQFRELDWIEPLTPAA